MGEYKAAEETHAKWIVYDKDGVPMAKFFLERDAVRVARLLNDEEERRDG
jgi:hypothetical protein